MIVVVAPEPAHWIGPVVVDAQKEDRVEVFAPWAMAQWLVRAWARRDTARRLTARFLVRRAVDALAARWIARHARDVRAVIAPSLAAMRVFAAASERGLATTLICDLPCLRRLHADLDRAARVHPNCLFLRRFRASSAEVARQEAERITANRLLVRGAYARSVLIDAGIAAACISPLPTPEDVAPPRAPQLLLVPTCTPHDETRVLLAGLATARNGSNEALAALANHPRATLLVRGGEGVEPRRLLDHPRVRLSTKDEREHLHGVGIVLAPAWCEAYPPEVARARALEIPVIATLHAAGFTLGTRAIEPGSVPRLDL